MDDFADEFEDDVLNELLGHDLDALEQQAFQSTQGLGTRNAPQIQDAELLNSQYDAEYDQNGDEDDEVIDTSRNEYGDQYDNEYAKPPPTRRTLPPYRPPLQRTGTGASVRGEGGRNAAEVDAVRAPLPRGPLQRTTSALVYRPGTQAVRAPQVYRDQPTAQATVATHGGPTETEVALQLQVQELLLERQKLQNAVQEANKQVMTKTGEIAIVRSKFDKSVQETERKVAVLQQEITATNEQHKAELEQIRRQQEKTSAESRFADHDRVLDKARKRKPAAKSDEDVIVKRVDARIMSKALTPRRSRHMSPGDGFTVAERSPSKLHSQAQQSTPTATEKKRKRLPESPMKQLSLQDDSEAMTGDDEPLQIPDDNVGHMPEQPARQDKIVDQRYEILQRFLNRRQMYGQKRNVEILAEHKYPSDANTALSTLIYDGISKLQSKQDAQDYPSALCALTIGLWQRCISEKHYQPLTYLSDLVTYMLSRTPEILPSIIDDLVPLLQKTADTNLIPRFKRSMKRTAADPGTESPHVNVSKCLESLIETALICDNNQDLLDRFWTLMRVDFLSILLRPMQKISHILFTCRLLAFSTRLNGFGSVLSDSDSQPANGGFSKSRAETHLVDRISALLTEVPGSSTGDEPYNQREIAEMRLEVLSLIETLAQNPYSGSLFAGHSHAVGRLVRCMNDEYHEAMEMRFGWQDRVKVVKQATRLLYHFVYKFADSMDVNEKLRAIPGGAHKYLIVLTRLAFSEGTIWGAEIEEDVVDCAHELLEDHVNPEEGEALMAAFQSPQSARRS